MPILDFREIAAATGGANRDQFELFAREFLESTGFKVISGPDRGADAGRDLLVEEIRSGVAGETRVKWLVSCKHNAHSGKSVTPKDEPDIHDRVRTHGCKGFIGFYSTVPSSGLATKLNAPNLPFEVLVFDQEKVEKQILRPSSLNLARRFFPKSFAKWQSEHPAPVRLFSEEPELLCFYCKKDLLRPKSRGIVVVWTISQRDNVEPLPERTEHLYWCCKDNCDAMLQKKYQRPGIIDGWEDIPDLIAPIAYLRWAMVVLNEFYQGMTYSDEAFKNMKTLLINLFPLVCREMTTDEQERIKYLGVVPHYLGGWGYEN